MTSPGVQWQEFEAMAVDEENSEFDSDHEYGGMMERISDDIKKLSELISSAVEDGQYFEVEATAGILTVWFVEPGSDSDSGSEERVMDSESEERVMREEWWTRMPPDFDLKMDELDELPWPFRLMNPAMALFPRVEELRMPVLWLQRMGHHMTDIAGWAPISTLILVHECSDDFFWAIGTNIAFRGVESLVFVFSGGTEPEAVTKHMPRFLARFFATHLAPPDDGGPHVLEEVSFCGVAPELESAIAIPVLSRGPTLRETDERGEVTVTFTDVLIGPHAAPAANVA